MNKDYSDKNSAQQQIASDIITASANISELNKRQNSFFEIRTALICELSEIICAADDISFERIKELYDLIATKTDGFSYSKKFFESISVIDKIEICRYIYKNTNLDNVLSEILIPPEEKISNNAKGVVAYVRNNYTESAFCSFARHLNNARPFILNSFVAVCEELYSGSCEYGILPIESSENGKLMTFYSMIDKYELKICSVCTVDSDDGQSFTKYALLGKFDSARDIFNASSAYLNKRSLEVRVSQITPNESPLHNILQAAYACSLNTCRIDSLPLSYNEDLLGYYIIFSMNDSDIKTFITYLLLEYPQSYIIGIYSHVN